MNAAWEVCPRCHLPVTGEMASCAACGFSLPEIDRQIGEDIALLDQIDDADGWLPASERMLVQKRVEHFRTIFPRHFCAVWIGEPRARLQLAEYGFWLLNRAALSGIDFTHPNENGALLLVRPQQQEVSLVLGYSLEQLVTQDDLAECLATGSRPLSRGKKAEGLISIINELSQRILTNSPAVSTLWLIISWVLLGLTAALAQPQSTSSADDFSLATSSLLAGVDEENELEAEFGLMPLDRTPDPLPLPRWTSADRKALDAGEPLILGPGASAEPTYRQSSEMKNRTKRAWGRWSENPPIDVAAVLSQWRGKTPLIDLGGRLPIQQQRECQELLQHHQKNSKISLWLLVLGPEEKWPTSLSLDDLNQQWSGSRPSLLLFWRLGSRPDEQIALNDQLRQLIKNKDSATFLKSHKNNSTPSERLLELSSQLMGLEAENSVSHTSASIEPVRTEAAATIPPAVVSKPSSHLAINLLLACGLATLAGSLSWLFFKRKTSPTSHAPHPLPDPLITPRLGAPHCGGTYATINWTTRQTPLMTCSDEAQRV